ncbi:hypothetical protein TSAR_000696 [Trichomalopsis sarcophagae]|uniref:Uncharacterized protein n=1 Tax=Trichomalopsis sarcophagae TaxID=543379 RepID=A0A232EUH9_9HYME|nr:hypothetical protein TSAR_000696 [Trichomalopsis sarcophagae]
MVTELKNSFDIFLPTRVSKLLMKDETVLKKLEEQMKSRDVYLKHLGCKKKRATIYNRRGPEGKKQQKNSSKEWQISRAVNSWNQSTQYFTRKLSDLEIKAYKITRIKKIMTRFGIKMVTELENSFDIFLPSRVSKFAGGR